MYVHPLKKDSAATDDGIDDDLGVVDDLHGLFPVVAAMHHEEVGKLLDDGALHLAEALRRVASASAAGICGA